MRSFHARSHGSRNLRYEQLEPIVLLSANSANFDLSVWEESFGATSITSHSQGDADGADFLAWQRLANQNFVFVTYANGNFDQNNVIDSADLSRWNQGFGRTIGAESIDGDANLDGDVDGADFLDWQRGFGSTSTEPFGIVTIDDRQSGVDQIVVSAVFDVEANTNVVTVNGNATSIATDLVEAIVVHGGDGDDNIDLSAVNTTNFPNLVDRAMTVYGGEGNDFILGWH